MRYAWARGLGRQAVAITAALAVVLVLLVIAMVWLLRDTPPVNAATYHHDGSGMDALLTGTLVMDRDCITVEADGQTYLPIFPSGSVRLEHDALLYHAEPYRTDDTISLAGGEVGTPPEDARIPNGGPTARLWLVAP